MILWSLVNAVESQEIWLSVLLSIILEIFLHYCSFREKGKCLKLRGNRDDFYPRFFTILEYID